MTAAALWAAIANAITRGRVTAAALLLPNKPRTLLQLTMLAGETANKVELLLPYGMSAVPGAGDVLVFQIGATRDHLVAIGADDSSLRIPDLAATEFGLRDARQSQVVFREDRLEVTTVDIPIVVNTGNGPITINTGSGDVTVTTTGTAKVTAAHARIDSADVILGGTAGGKKVVLDGDPVIGGAGGTVQATSTHVKAI